MFPGYEDMFQRESIFKGKKFTSSRLQNKSICGKRAGQSYLFATQPDLNSGECPGVLIPCSQNTSAKNTICYHPEAEREEVCPITSIRFERAGMYIRDGSIQEGYKVQEWSN